MSLAALRGGLLSWGGCLGLRLRRLDVVVSGDGLVEEYGTGTGRLCMSIHRALYRDTAHK